MFSWFQREVVDEGKLPLFLCLVAFLATFVATRVITRLIRAGKGPFKDNVSEGGLHVHHAVPGVFLLIVGAFLSLWVGSESPWAERRGDPRRHRHIARARRVRADPPPRRRVLEPGGPDLGRDDQPVRRVPRPRARRRQPLRLRGGRRHDCRSVHALAAVGATLGLHRVLPRRDGDEGQVQDGAARDLRPAARLRQRHPAGPSGRRAGRSGATARGTRRSRQRRSAGRPSGTPASGRSRAGSATPSPASRHSRHSRQSRRHSRSRSRSRSRSQNRSRRPTSDRIGEPSRRRKRTRAASAFTAIGAAHRAGPAGTTPWAHRCPWR